MIKIIKQEIEVEENLKKKIENPKDSFKKRLKNLIIKKKKLSEHI